MSLMEIFTLFSAVVFLIYGLDHAINGLDGVEIIEGIILVILSGSLLAIFIHS